MSGGSIYVLLWSTGAVKVGRSENPETRIQQHKQAARVFGVSLNGLHVVACADSEHAERVLIDWARKKAIFDEANEWFFGVDFKEACEFASTLREIRASDVPPARYVTDINRTVARAIRFHMDRLQMTEKALGVKAGLSPRTVANFLRPDARAAGKRGKEPSGKLTELALIAMAFRVLPVDLMEETLWLEQEQAAA